MNSSTAGDPYLPFKDRRPVTPSTEQSGLNSATIEIDLTNATSQVISGLPSTVYLITGTTNIPMAITPFSGNPSGVLFSGFTLDWTATLSDTSVLNSQGSPSVPSRLLLLLLAGGALGLAARWLIR